MSDDRSYEEQITAIYEHHFPEKMGEIPALLDKYAGKEKKLLKAMMKKFDIDEVPPSKKADEDVVDEEADEEDDMVAIIEKSIIAIYKVHLPEKLKDVPGIMEKYAGKEEKLLKTIMKKYKLTEVPDDPDDEPETKAEEEDEDSEDNKQEEGEEDEDGGGDEDGEEDDGMDPIEKAYIKTFRDRIAWVYKKCAPEKIAGLDDLLKKYNGNEAALLNAIEKKYGVQAPALGEEGEEIDGGGGDDDEDDADDDEGADGDDAIEQKYIKLFKDRIEAIYKVHAPDKLDTIATLLKKYQGNEPQLLSAIEKKYGVSADDDLEGGALAAAQKLAKMKVSGGDGDEADEESKPQVLEKYENEVDGDGKMVPCVVIYCPKCGMPPEYCEWGPCGLAAKPGDDEKTSKRKQKEIMKKQRKNEEAEHGKGGKVIMYKNVRNKRKAITVVYGLDNYKVKLKAAAKTFSKAFAASASVSKNPEGNEEIQIQGDVMDQVPSIMIKEFGIPGDQIFVKAGGGSLKNFLNA